MQVSQSLRPSVALRGNFPSRGKVWTMYPLTPVHTEMHPVFQELMLLTGT
jgi:hypothetical protein